MKKYTLPEALKAQKSLQETMAAYNHAVGVLMLDAATAAPKDSWEGRGRTMAVLADADYRLTAGDDTQDLLAFLTAHLSELDPVTRRQTEVLNRRCGQIRKIPAQEYIGYQVLLNDAQAVWEKAKKMNSFELFRPYLEKLVDYNRRFAGYYAPDKAPYDALLDQYEEGASMEMLDPFFAKVRETIVPLLKKIAEVPQIDSSFLEGHFPVDAQRALSEHLMDMMGLDRAHCTIAETEHPFTTNFNNKDVRITTHYYENNFTFSMYSVIHEGGHALYELGTEDRFNYTALTGGVSMGIHESQSRFYENLIGRSPEFIHAVMPELRKLFPEQLTGISEEQMWKAVNKAEPSLIRTEADELTYCLHIMVRYELEKELIDGTLPVSRIPSRWNALYKEYLGIDVPSDAEGCLQDSHWSGGSFGYFPSYALGSAYGAQFLAKMLEELGDIRPEIAEGNLARVTGWLREHIHRFASLKKPGELLRDTVGGFDPTYYTRYLAEKYTALYGLKA